MLMSWLAMLPTWLTDAFAVQQLCFSTLSPGAPLDIRLAVRDHMRKCIANIVTIVDMCRHDTQEIFEVSQKPVDTSHLADRCFCSSTAMFRHAVSWELPWTFVWLCETT